MVRTVFNQEVITSKTDVFKLRSLTRSCFLKSFYKILSKYNLFWVPFFIDHSVDFCKCKWKVGGFKETILENAENVCGVKILSVEGIMMDRMRTVEVSSVMYARKRVSEVVQA